jgi:hypothetical protein
LEGQAVLIERPVLFSSEAQDSGKIAIEVDIQLPLLVRPQFDRFDERAQNIGRFGPFFWFST